jgi:hypothetical protein
MTYSFVIKATALEAGFSGTRVLEYVNSVTQVSFS